MSETREGGAGARGAGEGGRAPAIEVLDGGSAAAIAGEVGAAYEAAFGAPPNGEGQAEFRRQRAAFDALVLRPGFRLATARHDGTLIGFAYGAPAEPGGGWWRYAREPLPPTLTTETGTRTFQLNELGVLPGHRRRGIGRAVTGAVLSGCGAARAALLVEPRLTANQRLYRAWGWRHIARIEVPRATATAAVTGTAGGTEYELYVLDLTPDTASDLIPDVTPELGLS